MREMVQPPYYLHQNHPNHQPPPPLPEYYNHNHHHHHESNPNPNLTYTHHHHEPISIPHNHSLLPVHIPKEQHHINTLFVSGLPDDVLPREIHNLFRRRPGFDSCQLKFTGRRNQVVAFVTFCDHQSAVMALQALDGVKFDPESALFMHIELARSNSRRVRKPGSGPYVVIDKRKEAAPDAEDTSSDDGNNESANQSQNEDPDSSNNNSHSRVKSKEKVQLGSSAATTNEGIESEGGLKPCSTLFIANLGPNCSDDELRVALSQFAGFHGMKMRAKGGMPVAFADYEEVEQATHAMEALQGSMLASSDRGGMHIEYARSKMRKP